MIYVVHKFKTIYKFVIHKHTITKTEFLADENRNVLVDENANVLI